MNDSAKNYLGLVGQKANGDIIQTWDTLSDPLTGSVAGALDRPSMSMWGPDNNIYVADEGNHRIVKYSSDGEFLGWIGGTNKKGWQLTGKATTGLNLGEMTYPTSVSVDLRGNVYALEFGDPVKFGNSRLQVYSSSGEPLGIYFEGEIERPYAVGIYNEVLYIADTSNGRILKYQISYVSI